MYHRGDFDKTESRGAVLTFVDLDSLTKLVLDNADKEKKLIFSGEISDEFRLIESKEYQYINLVVIVRVRDEKGLFLEDCRMRIVVYDELRGVDFINYPDLFPRTFMVECDYLNYDLDYHSLKHEVISYYYVIDK